MNHSTSTRWAVGLLRNLDDLKANQCNPLVAHLYAPGVARKNESTNRKVKQLVYAAVESLRVVPGRHSLACHAQRQYEIVMRYDLGGESRDAVASDLGIAQSKFYEERRIALRRFVDLIAGEPALKAEVALAEELSSNHDDPELFAARLRTAGQPDLAIAILRDAIGELTPGVKRTTLLCHLVATFCGANRIPEAAQAYFEARSAAKIACDLSGSEAVELAAEVDFAALQLSWHIGKIDDALRIGMERLATIRSRAERPARSGIFSAFAAWVGHILSVRGLAEDSVILLSEAVGRIELRRSGMDDLRSLEALICFANAQMLVGNIAAARASNKKAMALATSLCALQEIGQGHINESMMDCWDQDLPSALAHARKAITYAQAVPNQSISGQAALILAKMEAATGESRRALEIIFETREVLQRGSYLWILSLLLEGGILFHNHAYPSALRALRVATDAAQETSNYRALATGRRMMAEAYEGLGKRDAAIDAISESIPMLRTYGDPFSLREALKISGRLGSHDQLLAGGSPRPASGPESC